jgi:bacillolysin
MDDRAAQTPENRARAFLSEYGAAFGFRRDTDLVTVRAATKGAFGDMQSVRFRQRYRGVPVAGAELIVHLRGSEVTSVIATDVSESDLASVAMTPTIPSERALGRARALMRRIADRSEADPTLSQPRLEVFSRGVFEPRPAPGRLAWFVEARAPGRREMIWIDARSSAILLHFNQQPRARQRYVYDAQNSDVIPGTPARSEGAPATGQTDVDQAYDYSGHTYDYFFGEHGWDSYDGLGAPLVSHVRFCPPNYSCPWSNAWWDGAEMQYGEGFASADDVVAHELTHAVTEHTARLFYYKQSGALNESFSDIFGETVDLSNGAGDDSPAVRWLMGEDLPVGAIRSMSDPTLYGDPGKTSDPQFVCQDSVTEDIVHGDAGVLSHAYALMVDGGQYNGYDVAGIGLDKAGRIAFRVLSEYLGPASDFYVTYEVFRQACADLVGVNGITAADCVEVDKALQAVEIDKGWPCATVVPPPPPICPTGQAAPSFADDFEQGFARWTPHTLSGVGGFWPESFWPNSGAQHAYGDIYHMAGDVALEMSDDVLVPTERAYLRFSHYYEFGQNESTSAAGAVVEYSQDGGQTWQDAEPLISGGAGYNGMIHPGVACDLAGRRAFTGEIHGYAVTELSLAHLAGQSVRFRFRLAGDSDSHRSNRFWLIDDVRLYSCEGAEPRCGLTIADAETVEMDSGTVAISFPVRLNAPSAETVTVDYDTLDGTALASGDYIAQSGALTFPPDSTEQTINVSVVGDVLGEDDEDFFVKLSNPSGAVIDWGLGRGLILNDDEQPLVISIDDVVVTEGNSGTAAASFMVSLSQPSQAALTVQYATADGTATAGDDYAAVNGTLSIAPGATDATVDVTIIDDDHLDQPIETFFLNLFEPSAGTLSRPQAVCSIIDNEPRPQRVSLVKDIKPGSDGSNANFMTDIDGLLYFSADDGAHGATLWRSDGTEAGTQMVADVDPDNTASSCVESPYAECPEAFTRLGSKVLFHVLHSAYGRELWITDGTAAGTHLVKDINTTGDGISLWNGSMAALGERVVFLADDGLHGAEMWITDGTESGTTMVRDINPGSSGSGIPTPHPYHTAYQDGDLYFSVKSGPVGVWRTDGTTDGTTLVKGFARMGSYLMRIGNKIFFDADDGTSGLEPWISDGTAEGTALLKDILPGGGSSLTTMYLRDLNGIAVFIADDGVHGAELWRSDGTEQGTQLVKDICPSNDPYCFDSPLVQGDWLYFSADDVVHGRELWKSDGTPDGTMLVKDVFPGAGSGVEDMFPFGPAAGSIVFKGYDGVLGEELWRSDGTEAGTVLEADIAPGAYGSCPLFFTASGRSVFFLRLYDDVRGDELWALRLPSLRLSAESVVEGSTTHEIELNVTLENAGDQPVSVDFETRDGSAQAGSDYSPASGTIFFPVGGPTTQTIAVPIIGDVTAETDETFSIVLSDARNAVIETREVEIAILDDDHHRLNVTVIGGGTVSSVPGGIDCGSDCDEVYAGGTVVTLTATPAPGHAVTEWSGVDSVNGNTGVLTMMSERSVTVTFAEVRHELTVARTGSGSGKITSNPAGIDCGLDCSESFLAATLVTLTAAPDSGSVFFGWGDACAGNMPTCEVTMDEAIAVTAVFNLLLRPRGLRIER